MTVMLNNLASTISNVIEQLALMMVETPEQPVPVPHELTGYIEFTGTVHGRLSATSTESLGVTLALLAVNAPLQALAVDALAAQRGRFRRSRLDAFLDGNNSFHRLLAEASRNSVLSEYVDNIMLRTNVYILFYDPFDEQENFSTEEHRAILRAIAKRDIDGAERLIKEHLQHSHKALAIPTERVKIR